MSFQYELPTTGAISFSEFCVDQSTEVAYTSHLAGATQVRANLRGSLKENKRNSDEKDNLQLVKILDEYLPHLRGIIGCVAHDELGLRTEPVFSWRTTLSANVFNTSQRLNVPNLQAEHAFSLLTYAFALSNLARSIVASLGAYEHDRAISNADRKAKDVRVNQAVAFLCKASGIFRYISDTVLPEWEKTKESWPPNFNRPPDLSREVNHALSKMALADAQNLAIRKLLSKSAYDSNIAPGPPLPKSHPPPALVAKMHLECASLYSSARTLAKTTGATAESKGEVSADLRHYLADEGFFHAAMGRKWLGIDAGESSGSERGGDAVAFLIWAKKELDELKDGGKGISFGKGEKEKLGRSSRKEKVAEERESIGVWLKHYKKVNDTVHFQPVPTQPDLQARIPSGILAVASKAYVPPVPAFGPGSVEYLRRKAEELDVVAGSDATSKASSYAGQDAYY
ncbi:BRO1 domain-containing protein [Mycena floridula]|nr:BRO1 domain-containing protein [Mycena floridula]